MEGDGCGNNLPQRRAPRVVHDFDLNVKLEPDESEQQEQLPHNAAPEVTHDLGGENPEVDVPSDINKVDEKKEMDKEGSSKRKYARAGTELMPGPKIPGSGGINVPPVVDTSESNAGEKEKLAGPERKRPRTSSNITAEEKSGTPKMKWKSLDKEGDAGIQHSSPEEEERNS